MCPTAPGCEELLPLLPLPPLPPLPACSASHCVQWGGQRTASFSSTGAIEKSRSCKDSLFSLPQVIAALSRKLLILDNYSGSGNRNACSRSPRHWKPLCWPALISDPVTHGSRDPESPIWVTLYPLRALVLPQLLSPLHYALDPGASDTQGLVNHLPGVSFLLLPKPEAFLKGSCSLHSSKALRFCVWDLHTLRGQALHVAH